MIKLYYAPRTRGARPRWILEELGVPYEMVRLDMSKGEHKSPAYLKLQPHGAVPAMEDDGVAMFESAALVAHLADKFPEKKMAPPPGTIERGLYYQWMFYAMTTIEPPVIQTVAHTVMLPEEKRSATVVAEARKTFVGVAKVLEQALAGKQFILGDRFSAADVMVGSTLAFAQMIGMLGDYPALQEYVARLAARPAFQRAQAD